MLTINVIGKNCNVKIDDKLYTVVVNEKFDLKKLQNLGLKYYYNLNESKNYFDELGEHITSEKRASYKATADSYKERIKKMILEQLESQKKVKTTKDFEKKLEKKKLKEEEFKIKQVEISKKKLFSKIPEFVVKNNEVYLKGLNFVLPEDFLKVILEVENKQPYINFMYNLSSNPNEYVRNNVFTWVNNNQFKITENGYIYGVRWVVKKNDISELTRFVHSEYTKKKLQKKSPKNYYVYKLEGDGVDTIGVQYIVKNKDVALTNEYEIVGNLYDLFNNKEEIVFTDAHTQTFTIKIGEVVSMNRKDCDESNALCSRGLHFVSTNHAINNKFGDTLISVLVNPAMIVSIPNDSYPKIRCCEYYPYSILDPSVIEDFKNSDLVIDDTDFEMINIGKLFEDLVDKKDLYKKSDNKQRLKEIKEKLQSYKVKPDESEQLAVVNRTIKL
jgi:hypothetical protein